MKACLDVASCVPLKLLSCLDQKMSIRNTDLESFPSVQPSKQTRESGFSMDSNKGKISMKCSQNISFFGFFQINSCGCQMKGTVYNSFAQKIFLHSKAYSKHFRDCQTSIFHIARPFIHNARPLWKILRNNIFVITKVPLESPFWVSTWLGRSQRSMWVFELLFFLLIAGKFFLHAVHDSNWRTTPICYIDCGIALIELSTSDFEIILHQIEKTVVMASINSGILDDDEPVFLEILGQVPAVNLPVALLIQIIGDIDRGNLHLGAAISGQP